jgi:hypothetical protein
MKKFGRDNGPFYNQKRDLFIIEKYLKLTRLFFGLNEEEATNTQSIIRKKYN